jgi:hypothetical protein
MRCGARLFKVVDADVHVQHVAAQKQFGGRSAAAVLHPWPAWVLSGSFDRKHHIALQRYEMLAIVHSQGDAIQAAVFRQKHGRSLATSGGSMALAQQVDAAGAGKVRHRVCGPLGYIRPGATPQTRTDGASACACKATLRSSASLLAVYEK